MRRALATALYKGEIVTLGHAAEIARAPLADFMTHVSERRIPVIRGNVKTVREDVRSLQTWLAKGAEKKSAAAMQVAERRRRA